ncbi:hypothetical protein [Vibrio sp. EA2]|uniref:hypothetical protein n=1 Tax=Vibrio sp. EA2 TaxID=3079860 RepID=UPI0029495393|nr:hypothetical protein [Vibrio sp. EA2]MDV6251948.1 hypothetical protein [Vibrio sp. EA2]
MINSALYNDDFSDGPTPLELAELSNSDVSGENEAPTPLPLGSEATLADASAPPEPMMEAEMETVKDEAPPQPLELNIMSSSDVEEDVAPEPMDMDTLVRLEQMS